MESTSPPHSEGIYPPIVDPIKSPPQVNFLLTVSPHGTACTAIQSSDLRMNRREAITGILSAAGDNSERVFAGFQQIEDEVTTLPHGDHPLLLAAL